jgi:glyoxylase-like metal-dependent hydrolase (beta-lactamase superfamily II)
MKYLWIGPAVFIFMQVSSSRAAPDIPYRAQKLSDRVLFIKTGESTVMSNMTAINTAQGIVMVDAHYKPEWGNKFRGIAEETFGRGDFAYLIYSHAGVDHMGGSPAFSDAVIIGHDNCISQIDSLHRTIEDIDIRTGMAPRLKLIQEQMDAGPKDPARKTNLRESMIYWSELAELLASGFRYTKPSITFSDKLTLQMGDLSLVLSTCTPGYSQSDIVIHVPQEKLLVVGDIFVKHRIPLFHEKTDINRWADVFTPFIEGEIEIRHIIGCHGELMTSADLKSQLNYLIDLWTAVESLQKKGLNLEQVKLELSFNKRYAHLSHLITRWAGTPFDLHERNIEQAWKAQSNSYH